MVSKSEKVRLIIFKALIKEGYSLKHVVDNYEYYTKGKDKLCIETIDLQDGGT